jgi:hypothetical protein
VEWKAKAAILVWTPEPLLSSDARSVGREDRYPLTHFRWTHPGLGFFAMFGEIQVTIWGRLNLSMHERLTRTSHLRSSPADPRRLQWTLR